MKTIINLILVLMVLFYMSCIRPNRNNKLDLLNLKKSHILTSISVDQINGQPLDLFLQTNKEINKFLILRGWAVDNHLDTAAAGVFVKVNDKIFLAKYGIERLDVANYFKNQSFAFSGFEIIIPRDSIDKPLNTIILKIVSADYQSYYEHIVYKKDEIKSNLFDSLNISSLEKSETLTSFSIDEINGKSFDLFLEGEKKIGEFLTFKGWAIDTPLDTSASGVFVGVNDKLFLAKYGIGRPDVASYFKNKSYAFSGYEIIIPRDSLDKSLNIITLKIVSADKQFYYENFLFRLNL